MSKTCTSCGTVYPDSMVFCPSDGTSLRTDEAEGDLIGSVIADRYLVNKLLGEGGMGRVYLARHVRLPQQAAIKVLHPDMVKDAGAVARFNREAANAARIEHDRVARVFDFGETTDGLVYLAMEFVPGTTLRALIDETGTLAPVRAANLVYQVAEGLDAAHRLSIVHRDLKPDNILVITDESGVDRCKVVDFGIAKVTNSSETQLTQAGMLVGTPEFMSPEQVLGEQLDGRSDVYALALVAFEMFTGGLPFEGNTPERKLTARLIQDPRTLSDVTPTVAWPEALQQAFDAALVREPDGRTATSLAFADAVVAAVEAWQGTSVLRARTPLSSTSIGESTASVSRPATPTPTSTAPARSPTPTNVLASTASERATPGAGASASKTAIAEPESRRAPWAIIGIVMALVVSVGGYLAFGRSGRNAEPTSTEAITNAGGAAGNGTSIPNTAATTPRDTTGAAPTREPTIVPGASPSGSVAAAPNAAPNAARNIAPNAAPSTGAAATSASAPGPSSVQAAADAAEAQQRLSTIRQTLQSAPDGTEALVAARVIPDLQALVPNLGNATDSTWAYHSLALAYAMSDQLDRACVPYRNAKRLAATSAQRTAVEQLGNSLTCAP
jgi:serine/threonine-protein kinase